MTSKTFDDRRVRWHKARLSTALYGVLLCVLGVLVFLAASAIAILGSEGAGGVPIKEWAGSVGLGGAGWLLFRQAAPSGASIQRRVATAASLFAAVWAVLEAPGAMAFLSREGLSTLGVLHASICLAALAASLGAARTVYVLRAVPSRPSALDWRFPENEQEIVDLVREARAGKRTLRVHGSGHSVHAAIEASCERPGMEVSLVRFNRVVEWDDRNRRVRVEAGCVLGVDPASSASTRANSLLHQLERRGWALPLTGGVTHQTVSGFLATGSSGGSTAYGLGDCIAHIRLVDGTGTIHDLAPNPEDPDDELHNSFYAAGVSLGLLGVITAITFQCHERFDVSGSEITSPVTEAEVQLAAGGDRGLAASFRSIEYCRLMWWPQRGVERLQVWRAAREPAGGQRPARAYVQLPGGRLAQILLAAYFRSVNRSACRGPWTSRFMTWFMKAAVPNGKVDFLGPWLTILPMDNEIDNDLLPVSFNELWIDLDRSADVAKGLMQHYAGDVGHRRAGSFACELYAARKSRFWLSPSYGKDALRVDLMHIDHGPVESGADYFPQFWPVLQPFKPRYHWGKQMPPPGEFAGADYFSQVYPRWQDFLALRSRLDPDGIFVNEYWREYFGLRPGETGLEAHQPHLKGVPNAAIPRGGGS